jgi:predicted DNA-binding transcriptional regulator YafY
MARGDQLSRQWKIIQSLMAAGRGKSAAELARDLACHSRTVYRDLEALQYAGFPLVNERTEGRTAWSLLDTGKRNLPIPLNLTELMALYFSRNMLKILRGSAIYDSLASLFEKVKATLPAEYIRYLDKVANSLDVGAKPYKPGERFQDMLAQVYEATQNQRYIDIEYFTMSRQTLTPRRVAPYKIWFFDETFYLIGHCSLRHSIRLFAIDRIEKISISNDRFQIPEGFDADAFMHDSFGVFQGRTVGVKIKFAPSAAGYVQEKVWHPSQHLDPLPDGSLIFSAQVAGIDEIKYWVLKWGSAATVIEPEQLRSQVADEARAMVAAYR